MKLSGSVGPLLRGVFEALRRAAFVQQVSKNAGSYWHLQGRQSISENCSPIFPRLSVPMTSDDATLACDASLIGDNWCNDVDFVIDAGERKTRLSTVLDFTNEPPKLLREGEGSVDHIANLIID